MRLPLQKFVSHLKRGGQLADPETVFDFLNRLQMTEEEWGDLSPILCEAYGVNDEEALRALAGKRVPRKPFVDVLNDLEITGWLRSVTDYADGMESPMAFNFASALAIEAAVLRRRVFIDHRYFEIYPAIQVLLVAPAGMSKTTGADFMLNRIGKPTKAFNILPEEGSTEGLKKRLSTLAKQSGEASGITVIGELSNFVGKMEYNSTLVQSLCDLFDAREHKDRETVSRGSEKMQNIAVSAIMATNEELLAAAIPPIALGSGLLSRIVTFHVESEPKECPFPGDNIADPKEGDRLLADLAAMQFVKGAAEWARAAKPLYTKFYSNYKKLAVEPDDVRLSGWYIRCAKVHLPRLALLLSVSEDPYRREPPLITERHIHQAEGILKWISLGLPGVYDWIGTSSWGEVRRTILKVFKGRRGRVPEADLARVLGSKMSRKTWMEHLNDMAISGMVKRETGQDWEGGVVWKLSERLRR